MGAVHRPEAEVVIKIIPENSDKIAALLRAANGSAEAHTYCAYHNIAGRAEDALENLGIPKHARVGARFLAQSGEFRTTAVQLVRRPAGWWLESAREGYIYPNEEPVTTLTITAAQDAIAVGKIRSGYEIAR